MGAAGGSADAKGMLAGDDGDDEPSPASGGGKRPAIAAAGAGGSGAGTSAGGEAGNGGAATSGFAEGGKTALELIKVDRKVKGLSVRTARRMEIAATERWHAYAGPHCVDLISGILSGC